MVSGFKSASPALIENHPVDTLQYGSDEQLQALRKLLPVHMPHESLAQQEPLKSIRCDFRYIYVINWLYRYRGVLKLQNEYFDVDLFEIELLHMVNPPPIDESVLFISKLKSALSSFLKNSKTPQNASFEDIIRYWFGNTSLCTDLESEGNVFDALDLESRVDILYNALLFVSSYPQVRTYFDKEALPLNLLRADSLSASMDMNKGVEEKYLLLFSNTRLYKQIITFPELIIPKERKKAPSDPEAFYAAEQFDVKSTEFELIASGIYELNNFLLELYSKKKSRESKKLYSMMASDEVFGEVFESEIRKRKFLTNKRKETQLANLLATRKRSSRLEAKEKQRIEDVKLLELQKEEEARAAAEARMERRRLLRESTSMSSHQPANVITRAERLKMRKLNVESSQAYDTDNFKSPEISSASNEHLDRDDTASFLNAKSERSPIPDVDTEDAVVLDASNHFEVSQVSEPSEVSDQAEGASQTVFPTIVKSIDVNSNSNHQIVDSTSKTDSNIMKNERIAGSVDIHQS